MEKIKNKGDDKGWLHLARPCSQRPEQSKMEDNCQWSMLFKRVEEEFI